MITLSQSLARATRTIQGICLGVALLTTGAGQAEPRPEAYGSVPDHYANVRDALQARQWSAALAALQQLAREMPPVTSEAEFHNLSGFALRQHDASRLPAAIEHYRMALQIEPSHVQAREYLGHAHLMQGRPDLAREQLKEIEHHCGGRTCDAWQTLHRSIEAAARGTSSAP